MNKMTSTQPKKPVSISASKHHSYVLDEQGKEVEITTTMVKTVCMQLLKKCRTIKN